MNIPKLVAIVAAIAINCAVLAWLHAWSSNVAAAAAASAESAATVVTLPAINVYPTAEQLREARRTRLPAMPEQAGAGISLACLAMPYYSFAPQPAECTVG